MPEKAEAYISEPKAPGDAITFVASRPTLAVAPILLTPFVLFPMPPLHLTLRLTEQGQPVAPASIFFGVMFLAAAGLEIFLILPLVFPPRIIVTTSGWATVSFGRTTAHSWSDYLEAKEGRVSNERSLQPCIRLEPVNGGKPVNLLTGAYPDTLYDLVQVFKHAQAGRLIEPGDPAFPWAYLFAWIPLALTIVIAAVSWLGPLLVHRFS